MLEGPSGFLSVLGWRWESIQACGGAIIDNKCLFVTVAGCVEHGATHADVIRGEEIAHLGRDFGVLISWLLV